MKQFIETFLRIILLVVVLYTTSFAAFAGNKKKPQTQTPTKTTTGSVDPDLSAPTPIDTPLSAKNPGPELTPKLKKRHKVAIVPAPPPGQIPVYIPPKQ